MTTATLLLCRTEAKSLEFQRAVEAQLGRGVGTIISPAFRIEDIETKPAKTSYDHLIFTSANGALRADQLGLRSISTVFCVGPATTSKAKAMGFETIDAGGDVNELTSTIKTQNVKGTLLHVSGEHVAGDLIGDLAQANIQVERLVAYRQVPLPPTPEFSNCLESGAPKVLPFFSPRATLILEGVNAGSNTYIIAISEAVADCLGDRCKFDITIAQSPNFKAILDATCAKLVS